MWNPGEELRLVYYEGPQQIESLSWRVVEYDDGLLKVAHSSGRVTIFNVRSYGFLSAQTLTADEPSLKR